MQRDLRERNGPAEVIASLDAEAIQQTLYLVMRSSGRAGAVSVDEEIERGGGRLPKFDADRRDDVVVTLPLAAANQEVPQFLRNRSRDLGLVCVVETEAHAQSKAL